MIGPSEDLVSGEHRFNYDAIASQYAAKVDNAPYNALYERPAMLSVLPDIRDRRILDAGCGSGWYAERLLERGAELEAIDASAAMVDYARSRVAKLSAKDRAKIGFKVA